MENEDYLKTFFKSDFFYTAKFLSIFAICFLLGTVYFLIGKILMVKKIITNEIVIFLLGAFSMIYGTVLLIFAVTIFCYYIGKITEHLTNFIKSRKKGK